MDAHAHIAELTRKHRALDTQIEVEMSYAFSDTMRIGELKRRKLKLKEEIERLNARAH